MKELKKEFEKMLNKRKIVVEVKQDKMTTNYLLEEKSNIISLLEILYRKTILKANIKIKYNYNYTDMQTITISQKYTGFDGTITTFDYIYYNIPTSMGYLDTTELRKKLESEV